MKLKLIFNQKNLGDRISEFIFRQLGCDDIELVDMANQCSEENIVSVGSVMNFVDNHSIVWGAGFIGRNSSLGGDSFDFSNQLIKIPKEIKLVRGRYTDLKLSEMGLPMIKKYAKHLEPELGEIHGEKCFTIKGEHMPNTHYELQDKELKGNDE